MLRSVIRGVGSALPERVVDNHEMARIVDTTHEWIVERTGITQRYIAASTQYTSHLAADAARKALAASGVTADQIDLVIVATTTPDDTFPATAVKVQAALGITKGAAFDVQAVCSGFVYAMATADAYLKTGMATHALVIGADCLSRVVDWADRGTCILFGDGAGAVVLSAESKTDRGILQAALHADGRHRDLLYVDGGAGSNQKTGFIRMQGRDVFKHAVQGMSDATLEVLEKEKRTLDDVDWFIPHQANERIMEAIAKRLSLPPQKLVNTIAIHANTSAATIPLALDVAVRDGRIQKNHLIAMQALGGGLTWGALLVRF